MWLNDLIGETVTAMAIGNIPQLTMNIGDRSRSVEFDRAAETITLVGIVPTITEFVELTKIINRKLMYEYKVINSFDTSEKKLVIRYS